MAREKGTTQSVEIPKGIEAQAHKGVLTLKHSGKQVQKIFAGVLLEVKEGKIMVSTKKATKNERKLVMTSLAHIKNMIKGLTEDFVYKLKVCAVHFPMTVTVDKGHNQLVIKNFLGEKKERRARILPGVEVKVNGEEIVVTSHNIESAGQTAANFEKTTIVKNRDRRVFQDGIFLTERRGEKI